MSAAERTQRLRQFSQQDNVPNSWSALLALACFIAIASVIGIGLMQRYLYTKPVYAGSIESGIDTMNELELARIETAPADSQSTEASFARYEMREDLTAKTTRIAHSVSEALRAAGSQDVRTARSELRQSDAAMWQYSLFNAQLPIAVSEEIVTTHLAMAIADSSVRIEKISGAPQGQTWWSVRCNGIECATVHAINGPHGDPNFKLAAFSAELAGLDPDELVQEFHADPETLPLDSNDFKIDAPMPSSSPTPPVTGPLRLAIIVDDGGYGGWITEEILAMPNTLTLSILPHAPYSYETAQRASELGFEIMLHMPMENVSGKTTYPGEITVTMDANQMMDLTKQALADVPGAVGINNHTGSKFTSNEEAMRTWLDLIKDSGYFFIDSRTSKYACAFEVADEMEIPSAEN
ncbi:MAG: divergent polysaccharide deacetylase family protein, partial [Candidatus Hydrogenedentes bacterium]|nr:divergent polysaccharide deacetylase family protein [Candidatus Hydrogenedentota bacterium]